MAWGLVPLEGLALSWTLLTAAGPRELPVGSLVDTQGTCADGVRVEVLSVAGWIHPEPAAAVSDQGCLSRIAPLEDAAAVALSDGDRVAAGEVVDAVRLTTLGRADIARVRFVAPELLAEVRRTQAVYAGLFGPIGLHELPWTDWGRLGLPLRMSTPAEIALEQAREGLLTPVQRERTVVGFGPAWAHFLGSDPPGSDTWADPEALRSLLRLAASWQAHCAPVGDPRCLLQIGDLSWYNATRPDPLGHKDHAGDCVDIRLFRTDGSRYEAWWNRPDDRTGVAAYDRARTLEFLRFAATVVPVREVFFNDPAAGPLAQPLAGHDDHVHLCFGAAPG